MNTETSKVLDATYVLALTELIDTRAGRVKEWVEENRHLLPGGDELLEDLDEIITRNEMVRTLAEFAFATPEKSDQFELAI